MRGGPGDRAADQTRASVRRDLAKRSWSDGARALGPVIWECLKVPWICLELSFQEV